MTKLFSISAKSLRESGFESELYDLGFSDYFYANLLLSDTRFSFTMIYGSMVFFKGICKQKWH